MLLLLHLFVFRQLLLLILVLVFLATLVSHACSFFSDCDLSLDHFAVIRELTLPQFQSGRVNAAEPGFERALTKLFSAKPVSLRVQVLCCIGISPYLCRFRHSNSACREQSIEVRSVCSNGPSSVRRSAFGAGGRLCIFCSLRIDSPFHQLVVTPYSCHHATSKAQQTRQSE